jgi:hypothetical protein
VFATLALTRAPVPSIALVFILSLAFALMCAAVPWLARTVHFWPLLIVLVAGVIVLVVAAALVLPFSVLTDLAVLVVAWSAGLFLGRAMPARFPPFLLLFVCISVVDILLALGGYPQTPKPAVGSSPLVYTNFILMVPRERYEINLADLLLITAVAEHWRLRGGGYLIAVVTGVVGFLLADGVVLTTGLAQLPGFPFFAAGYLGSEGVYRYVHRAAPPAPPAR